MNNLYTSDLHRPVDPSGLATWSTLLGSGTTDESVIALSLSRPEFFASLLTPDLGTELLAVVARKDVAL